MKQIFDWIMEQMHEYSEEMHDWDNESFKVVEFDNVENIINEAEAKWESDCCEWHRIESSEFDYMDSKHGFLEEYTTGWKFCPYCGKPIKISEVD